MLAYLFVPKAFDNLFDELVNCEKEKKKKAH